MTSNDRGSKGHGLNHLEIGDFQILRCCSKLWMVKWHFQKDGLLKLCLLQDVSKSQKVHVQHVFLVKKSQGKIRMASINQSFQLTVYHRCGSKVQAIRRSLELGPPLEIHSKQRLEAACWKLTCTKPQGGWEEDFPKFQRWDMLVSWRVMRSE